MRWYAVADCDIFKSYKVKEFLNTCVLNCKLRYTFDGW
jgi:hypothetical protein